jgi:alkylation response protein AidB-like acyl-CoA dehydrogenase
MDVGPNDGQLALRHSVRDVLRAECPPEVARQAMTDPNRWRTLWKTVVGLGWTELAAPGADTSLGAMELALVLEECGAAIAPIPLLNSVGLAGGVLRAAGPALDWVRRDVAAGTVAALGVHQPGRRLPGVPMTLGSGRLRGHAVAVPGLTQAELLVTLAAGDNGVVVAVARTGDGVVSAPIECTDPAQPVADVDVDTVPIDTAPVDVESVFTAARVAAAADLVGVADAVLARSVQHATSRRQFGTPIGAFQGIKHALADNYVSLERARSLSYAAAAHLDDPDTTGADAWRCAALAKAAAAEAAVGCARTAVQVHGAIAQTWEHDLHLYLRHAWQAAATLGDSRALYHAVGARFSGGRGAD